MYFTNWLNESHPIRSPYSSGSQPGVLGPLEFRNKILGGAKCDCTGWKFVCSLMYIFSKEPRFVKACKCCCSKKHYLAWLFQLTLQIYQFQWRNTCNVVSARAEVTALKMAADTLVSGLWRLNVYGVMLHSIFRVRVLQKCRAQCCQLVYIYQISNLVYFHSACYINFLTWCAWTIWLIHTLNQTICYIAKRKVNKNNRVILKLYN